MWNMLAEIPIGTVVGWVIVIGAIIAGICTGTIKLYSIFTKYRALKDKASEKDQLLKEHEEELKQINSKLDNIAASLAQQQEVNLKQIRHTIVSICNNALDKKEITASMLKVLEEMFEEYQDVFHANGYVKTLVMKVRKLPVHGIVDDY